LQHGSRHMLNSQYRMTPEISHFPSSQFYDSELKDGSNVRASDYGIVFANALPYGAYAFLNCGFGAEAAQPKGWKNPQEVAVVTKLLNSLRKGTDSDRRSKKSHKT
jgi:superfamily I DNA and/or RNA helicase